MIHYLPCSFISQCSSQRDLSEHSSDCGHRHYHNFWFDTKPPLHKGYFYASVVLCILWKLLTQNPGLLFYRKKVKKITGNLYREKRTHVNSTFDAQIMLMVTAVGNQDMVIEQTLKLFMNAIYFY